MAAFCSYCQICGLALQHDHLVPSGASNFFQIYRSSEARVGREQPSFIEFGKQHDWLNEVVTLPHADDSSLELLRGTVEDGHFTSESDPNDSFQVNEPCERAAVHVCCWSLAGEPRYAEELLAFSKVHRSLSFLRYHGQYFDYPLLKKDIRLHLLEDPRGESEAAAQSKARILAVISEANTMKKEKPSENLARASDIFAANDWRSRTLMNGDHREVYRSRRHIETKIDKENFVHLFWWQRKFDSTDSDFPTGLELENIETVENKILSEFERKKLGVLLASAEYSQQKWIFHVGYTHDRQTCEAVFRSFVEKNSHVEDNLSFEDDPEWKVYFEEVAPKFDH